MTVGNTIKEATVILYQRTLALNAEIYKNTSTKKKTSDKR
jgi:hypothetical protein